MQALRRLFGRLFGDRGGNTLAIVAAAMFPLIALVGSSIDMGRAYLVQARLQAACDAGVLAGRKQLATYSGTDPASQATPVQTRANVLFNNNFPSGFQGVTARSFTTTVQPDFSVSAAASATVPTTIMQVFRFTSIPLVANCRAKLNLPNTDVMMVLDTTGSMADTNAGDPKPKIDILRDVVKSFTTTLESVKPAGTRIRYGFVPYSANVNVGGLLRSDWLVDRWRYHGRVAENGHPGGPLVYSYAEVSGSVNWGAAYQAASCPANTYSWVQISGDATAGSARETGIIYNCQSNATSCTTNSDGATVCTPGSGTGFTVTPINYNNHVYSWTSVSTTWAWRYKQMNQDVRFVKGATGADPPIINAQIVLPMGGTADNPQPYSSTFRGCIEERDTYEITDYGAVDFNRALDLNLDLVPNGNDATRWRPVLNEFAADRAMNWDGTGAFSVAEAVSYGDYFAPYWAGLSACPAPAQKLRTMTGADVDAYLATLSPNGSTYHDIGMIWGGRLLSPTGLFATENADLPGSPTQRHLIFLTDGMTSTRDLTYGTYGVEPLDQRRWSPGSALTLDQVVENRFTVACNEVKRRNITVWVIGFGTTLNPVLSDCAGPGHSFTAANAAQLSTVFTNIAAQLANLRIAP